MYVCGMFYILIYVLENNWYLVIYKYILTKLANLMNLLFTVPYPSVQITASNNKTVGNDTLGNLTVGDPLTLNCTVTTVRGISSSVNIMWYTGGSVVRRVDNLTVAYTVNYSAIYTDLFEISSLTVIDNGREYQCRVVIIASQRQVYASGQITLNFNGEHLCIIH